MESPLVRTASKDSASAQFRLSPPLSLSSASSSTSRKGRSSDPDTTSGNVERARISMPPPATKSIARQYPSRRPSKASDSQLVHPQSSPVAQGDVRTAKAVDADTTPTLEGNQRGLRPANAPPLMLPEAALRPSKPLDADAESNRLSFSSLYSLGSAIYNSAKGITASGPSSVAGSEPECQYITLIGLESR
jgi:inositol-hexakisphosphate/diphosphoinositol-pentakisphosphate 1-kinase